MLASVVISIDRETPKDRNFVLKVMKNRYNVAEVPEIIEREDHFALKADGYSMPTEHTAKVLDWLSKSGLDYFISDSHFAEIRVYFRKLNDTVTFKLFWVK